MNSLSNVDVAVFNKFGQSSVYHGLEGCKIVVQSSPVKPG